MSVQALVSGPPGNQVLMITWIVPGSGAAPTSHTLAFYLQSPMSLVAQLDAGPLGQADVAVPPQVRGTFLVRVTPFANGNQGPTSDPAVFFVGTSGGCMGPPPRPEGLRGGILSGTATLGWNPSPGAATYIVQAGSAPATSDLFDASVGGSVEVMAAGLPPGFHAFTRVIAVDPCGNQSPASDEFHLTDGSSVAGTTASVPRRLNFRPVTRDGGWRLLTR